MDFGAGFCLLDMRYPAQWIPACAGMTKDLHLGGMVVGVGAFVKKNYFVCPLSQ
jgi:hypothetical protein